MAKAEQRSSSRLAACQALYQMDVTGKPILDVFAEFENFWIGQEVEGVQYKPAEIAFFRSIVQGVLEDQIALDRLIDGQLQSGWPLRRIDALMRAILRAGAFELKVRPDVPVRVVLAEYVDLASAFFERDESGMINAVLDGLARQMRLLEFKNLSP